MTGRPELQLGAAVEDAADRHRHAGIRRSAGSGGRRGAARRRKSRRTRRRLGATLAMPDIIAEAWKIQPVVQEFEAHQSFAWEYRENYDQMPPLLRGRLDESKGTTPEAYDAARSMRQPRPKVVLAVSSSDVDVLLTFSAPGAPPRDSTSTGDPRLQPAVDADGRALRQRSRVCGGGRIAGRGHSHRAVWDDAQALAAARFLEQALKR